VRGGARKNPASTPMPTYINILIPHKTYAKAPAIGNKFSIAVITNRTTTPINPAFNPAFPTTASLLF
jgi:hypothetical protein